jgi:hypothetical protein
MATPAGTEKSAREEGDSGEMYHTRAGRRSTIGAAYPKSTDDEGAVGGALTTGEGAGDDTGPGREERQRVLCA